MKAKTSLTLGKNYRQDQALDWGFLTEPEVSHLDRKKAENRRGLGRDPRRDRHHAGRRRDLERRPDGPARRARFSAVRPQTVPDVDHVSKPEDRAARASSTSPTTSSCSPARRSARSPTPRPGPPSTCPRSGPAGLLPVLRISRDRRRRPGGTGLVLARRPFSTGTLQRIFRLQPGQARRPGDSPSSRAGSTSCPSTESRRNSKGTGSSSRKPAAIAEAEAFALLEDHIESVARRRGLDPGYNGIMTRLRVQTPEPTPLRLARLGSTRPATVRRRRTDGREARPGNPSRNGHRNGRRAGRSADRSLEVARDVAQPIGRAGISRRIRSRSTNVSVPEAHVGLGVGTNSASPWHAP